MVTFYRFPKGHWIHLRTTNGGGVAVLGAAPAHRCRPPLQEKVANAEALIWKILTLAEKKFRRLNAPELLVYALHWRCFSFLPVSGMGLSTRKATPPFLYFHTLWLYLIKSGTAGARQCRTTAVLPQTESQGRCVSFPSEILVHAVALSFADSQSVPCIDEISSGTAAPVRSTTTTNG
jgi:hypothetical protein